jgi:N-hydroxyarylamine O-acetyltransferase
VAAELRDDARRLPLFGALMIDLDAYFRRIGYSGSRTPTLETLAALHALHPTAIPFENLDTLRGAPVRLDPDSLQRKLVQQRRGGYCFEQNLLFTHVLTALGFRVTGLSARVLWEAVDGAPRPRTHMLLLVPIGPESYLCDVGFGGLTMTGPLRLTLGAEQRTPDETFRVMRDGGEYLSQANVRGDWRTLYRFDLQEQLQPDIEVANFYVAQHPESPFRSRLMAARRDADRTFKLRDWELTIQHRDGRRERRELDGLAELRAALDELFRIDVPVDAALDAALARLVA